MAFVAAAMLSMPLHASAAPAADAPASAVPVAVDARLAGDKDRTRLIVDLDRVVDFKVFPLADPYRLIIDMPEIDFRLPRGLGQSGRGIVTAYRYGVMGRGRSRIVMDLSEPGRIDKAFILEPVEDQPARLVVDIIGSTREAFLAAVAESSKEMVVEQSAIPMPVGPNTHEAGAKPMIVIDPGHGGIDPGAVSGENREKDVVLAMAKALRDELKKTGKFEVALTRDEDVFIPLADRVEFARSKKAVLMVSLHADSLSAHEVSGSTIYTLSEGASDALSAKLAEQENRSDAIAGVDLSDKPDEVAGILIDLVRRETKNLSVTFARSFIGDMRKVTHMNKNPHRYAGFWVLKAPEVPSVLIELGYMTNGDDVAKMTDPEWRVHMAKALTKAIDRQLGAKIGSIASN
ncbi:MAG: N-acetylmuramoyl-L-alanine amidase [Rhodobiaceae bacterium]|nr:N-acetylmuramoyl-L-alanine amidase [Rhodobiaceae bacterium]